MIIYYIFIRKNDYEWIYKVGSFCSLYTESEYDVDADYNADFSIDIIVNGSVNDIYQFTGR